jgi:predicted phage terminase large subunit-like protein
MTDVVFPPGYDAGELLRPLFHGAWQHVGAAGREYRRQITRDDPLLFAITYFGHYLRGPDGSISFNDLHMALIELGRSWMEPGERRDAVVAPREAGKSVWLFVVLPLWALAHGHRRFFLAFSATGKQASGHLSNLRGEIKGNARLLADFPELKPRRGQDSADLVVMAGGAAVAARGMGETSLGARAGEQRPDLIVGDDMEPPEADYGTDTRDNTISRITAAILPMNTRAAVALTGTVVTYGSVMHDVVLAATDQRHGQWLDDEQITPHYFPAIIVEDGRERSLWPQRWSLEWLQARRGTHSYALNFDNNPSPKGSATYWTADAIGYDARVPVVRRIVYVDPATTTKVTSDYTAIVMVGMDASGRRCVVEHAVAGHWDGGEIREQIWDLKRAHPRSFSELVLETNQGGEAWRRALSPLPPGVTLREVHSKVPKVDRIRDAAEDYRRFAVVHAHPLPALEAQMLAYPRVRHDDLVDALAGVLAEALADQRALL